VASQGNTSCAASLRQWLVFCKQIRKKKSTRETEQASKSFMGCLEEKITKL